MKETDPIEALLDEWEERAGVVRAARAHMDKCEECYHVFGASESMWEQRIWELRKAADEEDG